MRIVTAGIGLRAGHVLTLLREAMPEAEVVGCFDPQPTHLAMIGEDTPCFATLEAMLSEARADLLLVGSPDAFHLRQIRLGLEAGLRVFAEKAVVVSAEETMAPAALLARHGPERVMVGLVLRHSRPMADLRAALREGGLGDCVLGEVVLGEGVSLDASEHIAPSHGAFFMRDWRRRAGWSGGFMLEKCCHDLDLCNAIGASRPARVASFGGRRSLVPGNAPTSNAEAAIVHSQRSVRGAADDPFASDADIIGNQTALPDHESGATPAFHANLIVPDEHRRFCAIGTHGMAEGDFVRGVLRVTRRDGSTFAHYDDSADASRGAHCGADALMVREVAAYPRGEAGSPPVGALDAMEAGIAALATDQARAEGRIVDLSETWARLDAFGLRS